MTIGMFILFGAVLLLLSCIMIILFLNRRLLHYGIHLSVNQHSSIISAILTKLTTLGPINENLIVSLSTTFNRLNVAHRAIESIIFQSLRPASINLYISDKISKSDIPETILRLTEFGLKIHFVNDIGPHTKLIYALRDFPNNNIVTIDDDVYYPPQMINTMWNFSKSNPEFIVANWARKISFGFMGHVKSARKGKLVTPKTLVYNLESSRPGGQCGFDLFPYGSSGVLYPPNCMDQNVFDIDSLKQLCPTEDDVWFKAMSLLHGTSVMVTNLGIEPKHHDVQGSQTTALRFTNHVNGSRKSRDQIKVVFEKYRLYERLRELKATE